MVAAVQSSWLRRGAKGQLLQVLLARLPLTVKAAEEQVLCMNSVAVQPVAVGGGDSRLMVLILMVVAFVVGASFGWWRRGRSRRDAM